MTAVAAIKHVDPLDAFIERAQSRALLWSIGELTLHDAVDQLQADAVRDGLIKQIGQDAVQQIMADAFAPYQHALYEQGVAL
jgi:hypothetical protein